jgi:hypothetical protein
MIKVLRRPVESALAALIGMHDHLGDGVLAAAQRDRHLQRSLGQVGIMMLTQAEPDDPPRTHVQHAVSLSSFLCRLRFPIC